MNLNEAKQELIEHGYIIAEDTDPYMNSLDKELDDISAEKRLKVAMKDVVEVFEALEIPGENGKTFEFIKQNDYPIEYAAYQKQGDYENCMTIVQSSLDEFGVSIQCRNTKTGKEHGYGKFYLYSEDYKNDLQECIEDSLRLWKKMVETNDSTFKKVVRRALGESINEDTETNDAEIEDLNNEWRDKHNNRASDKELDDIFWKRNKVEKRHLDLEDKIAAAKQFNSNQSWSEDDVQEIRDAIYARFDPDFGGLNKWSVETGNNGKNYVYFKDDEVCRVAYNKKEKSVNLNFGDGMGVDFEFDPEEETFEEFIKFILTRIKEKNYG